MSKTALLTTASFIAFSAVAQAGVPHEDVWSSNSIIKYTPTMEVTKSLSLSEKPEVKGKTETSDSFFIVPLTEKTATEETGNLSESTETIPPSPNLPRNVSNEGTYNNRVLEALMEGIAYGAYYALGGSNIAYTVTKTTFTFFGYEPGIHEELYMPLLDPLRETATEYAARIANTGRFMMIEGVSLAHRGFSNLPTVYMPNYWAA